jgi:hypothetical protein
MSSNQTVFSLPDMSPTAYIEADLIIFEIPDFIPLTNGSNDAVPLILLTDIETTNSDQSKSS